MVRYLKRIEKSEDNVHVCMHVEYLSDANGKFNSIN